MQHETFTYTDSEGNEIFVNKWTPDAGQTPKAALQIAHGLGEHSARYSHVAEAAVGRGYIVYADDHIGHGKTAGDVDKLGTGFKKGTWELLVENLKQLTDVIKQENPGLPVFFLGHSWGSFMGQDYIQNYGDELAGAIFSGTSGAQDMLGPLNFIAKLITFFKGAGKVTALFDKLALKPLNDAFKPNRTTHDWLSRDEEVVDKYIEDPYCGFDLVNGFWVEFARGMKKIWNSKNEAKIPTDLPILLFTGAKDPVNNFGENFMKLVDRYQALGIEDLTFKLYEDARHETLNELEKDQTIADVLDWLDDRV